MNTLFCTVAKHLFGIKMCTSVPVFFFYQAKFHNSPKFLQSDHDLIS